MAEDLTVTVVRRGLQWLRTKAKSCLTVVHLVFCYPSSSQLFEELNSVRESAARPPQRSVVTIINISNSTLNNCNFTSQAGPQAGPDLLQMPPELPINGERRSFYITDSELHYAMFGDHTVMTVDLAKTKQD